MDNKGRIDTECNLKDHMTKGFVLVFFVYGLRLDVGRHSTLEAAKQQIIEWEEPLNGVHKKGGFLVTQFRYRNCSQMEPGQQYRPEQRKGVWFKRFGQPGGAIKGDAWSGGE